MATGTRALTLKLLADVDSFTKNLNKADNNVSTFGDKVTKFGKTAGLAFAAAGAAAVAYAGKLAIDGVKSAIEDEAAQAKLANTLRNVTEATDAQIKSTEKYILKTSLATGISDDELRPSLDRLTRATKDLDKAQQLQTLALDIAAGSGKSLQAVTESLSKAQEGNLAGLSRLGVGISKAELATLSFDQITAKLSGTFENQASKQAETFQGKMARLQVAFNEAKETVGSYILDAVTPMVNLIVQRVIPAVQTFIDSIGGEKGLNGAFSTYIDAAKKIFIPILDGLKNAFNTIKDAVMRNKDELTTLFNFLRDYVGPLFGGALKIAIEGIGIAFSVILDVVGLLIKGFEKVINLVKKFIDISKSIGSGVGNFFSGASSPGGASFSNAASFSSPSISAIDDSDMRLRAFAGVGSTNITVNGAIDPISTARQIANLLNSEATNSGSFNALGVSRAYLA